MLLNNANIKIYLPFILCCENISANSKGSTMQTISFIDNIKGSHHQLTTKFNEFDVEILPIDFFKFNSDKFKEEYIEESAKIGFDHINNLLIPFKNIKYDKNNKSNDDLFLKFKVFLQNCETKNVGLKNIIDETSQSIDDYLNVERVISKKINFDKIKSLILSMKEMRDWFYIKEIINRQLTNPIFCTADTINCLRATLYGIPTINTNNKHFKFMTHIMQQNNNRYLIYKQLSPTYTFSDQNKFIDVRQNIFNTINSLDTNIIKKNLIGGNIVSINLLNTNIKKHFNIKDNHLIKTKLMSNTNDKFTNELNHILYLLSSFSSLQNNIKEIDRENPKKDGSMYSVLFYDDFDNKNNLNIISEIYEGISKLHKLCDSITIDELKNILSESEVYYKEVTYLKILKKRINDKLDFMVNKLSEKQLDTNPNFYLERNLTEKEKIYSIIILCVVSCDYLYREIFGYNLKMLLSTYEYELIRNVLHLFNDDNDYNDYYKFIRGAFDLIDIPFSNGKTEYVENNGYTLIMDTYPIKYYEKQFESKYDNIIKLINEKI